MRVLEHLEPSRVFYYFEELCAIPHGSGHTKAISDYCVRFAREHGLVCRQDAADNIIIVKEAAPGCEAAPTVILQGHLDMVCEKEAGCDRDMEKEGPALAVEDGWVHAVGTTLGGDDGIAVAMALAILEAGDLTHPRLEAVFTSGEEVGMTGAAVLDTSSLRGRLLLNLDSEDEGIFIVSCAGGVVAECHLPVRRETVTAETFTVTVGGLQGGHSGTEIGKGRGMANQLMGRVLCALQERTSVGLVSVNGGLKDNAITLLSTAVLTADEEILRGTVEEMDAAFRAEYRIADPGVYVKWTKHASAPAEVMTAADTARAVCLLTCMPEGVEAMSREIPGLVQTSLNLGILQTSRDEVTAAFSIRSSVATQKEMLRQRLACQMALLGGSVTCCGDYPAWEYCPDSRLRQLMTEVFTRQYGYAPKVEAMHAGVECGLLSARMEGLDCVSYGPELLEIHTPRERMNVASVERTWRLTLEVLRRLS